MLSVSCYHDYLFFENDTKLCLCPPPRYFSHIPSLSASLSHSPSPCLSLTSISLYLSNSHPTHRAHINKNNAVKLHPTPPHPAHSTCGHPVIIAFVFLKQSNTRPSLVSSQSYYEDVTSTQSFARP